MRKILDLNEIEILKDYLDEDSFERATKSRHAYCELENNAYLILFYFYDIRKQTQKTDRVCIYCSSGNLIYLTDNAGLKKLAGTADENTDNFLQLSDFLTALTAEDVYALEKIENMITLLEESLLKQLKAKKESASRIISLRRDLLKIKRFYEQLALVTNELSENRCDLFNCTVQKRYDYLLRRTDRLVSAVGQLREYITQVREAYQAQIDIEQNQIMKVFTVITTVFLPLTLIVGWYGMNLQMPEFGWSFGYPFVIMLSIAVCAVSVIIFKLKKWF